MTDRRAELAQQLKTQAVQKYGHQFAVTGRNDYKQGIVSTGSLLWDYMTGIGGHKLGAASEVFGAPEIGKTTIAGFSALRNAQAQGMVTGLIAVEPNVDEKWMIKHGVNPEYNVLARPDNGEEAFGILYDWVYGGDVGFIVFDSIGAVNSNKAIESDKPQAYGNSALISWGVPRIIARAWKNHTGLLFINQQRDDTKSKIAGLVESPGGWAFKHAMTTRTHLKPGKDRYTTKMGSPSEDVLIGRQIIATFKKNKAAESLGKSARFDFYHVETDDNPFGFDVAADIISAAKVSGVFEGAGWLKWHGFPKGKLNGKAAVADWIAENPERLEDIRQEVLGKMREQEAKLVAKKNPPDTPHPLKPELKAV